MVDEPRRGFAALLAKFAAGGVLAGFIVGALVVWWAMSRARGPKTGRPEMPSHCSNHASQSLTLHVQPTCPGAVDQDPVALCAGDKITWTKGTNVDTFKIEFTGASSGSSGPAPAPLQDPTTGKDKSAFTEKDSTGLAKSVSHISNFPADSYFDYTVSVNGGQACDPGIIIVR